MAIGTALAAALAGGALAGVGSGVGSALEAGATKSAAKEAARGPVRGGSMRAGNQDDIGIMPDASVLERLGQTALPLRSPVYGNPIDMTALAKPQNFGAGYNLNQKRQF